jgi:hypothetical protein
VKIRIDVPHSQLRGQEVLTSIQLLTRLKEAGVPIIGKLIILGVERGTLSHSNEPDGTHVFEWVDEADLFV